MRLCVLENYLCLSFSFDFLCFFMFLHSISHLCNVSYTFCLLEFKLQGRSNNVFLILLCFENHVFKGGLKLVVLQLMQRHLGCVWFNFLRMLLLLKSITSIKRVEPKLAFPEAAAFP